MSVVPSDQQPDSRYKSCVAATNCLSVQVDEASNSLSNLRPMREFQTSSGALMPLYLSQHTLACLTRQGAEALMRRMQAGEVAKAERVLVNMLEGKMFAEFRADSREALEAWLKTEGMHFDWLVRIEWESREGQLVQVV
jgi:cytosine/adenosine deaminase-related metal-dependent hydrolase